MDDAVEMRLEHVSQIFETLDPYPFRDRELSQDAIEYITRHASLMPKKQPIQITVHLPEDAASQAEVQSLDRAISNYFLYSHGVAEHQLRELLRTGRRALLLGLAVLALCLVFGQAVSALTSYGRISHFLEEGAIIVGWVALWHPLNILLYDSWPLREQAKLHRRLSEAKVALRFYPPAPEPTATGA